MKPESKQLGVIGHNVVIDNGTNTVKGGFSTADAPQCRIPTIVGHGRHKVSIGSLKWKKRVKWQETFHYTCWKLLVIMTTLWRDISLPLLKVAGNNDHSMTLFMQKMHTLCIFQLSWWLLIVCPYIIFMSFWQIVHCTLLYSCSKNQLQKKMKIVMKFNDWP